MLQTWIPNLGIFNNARIKNDTNRRRHLGIMAPVWCNPEAHGADDNGLHTSRTAYRKEKQFAEPYRRWGHEDAANAK